MPGLRHAHTLQQLRSDNEYSPPGEYLIITKYQESNNKQRNNRKNIREQERINIL